MKIFTRILFGFFFVTAVSVTAQPSPAGVQNSSVAAVSGTKIDAITIEGNKAIQSDAILNLLEVKAGYTITSEQIKKIIQSLFKSGFFEDVQVSSKSGTDGHRILLIKVTEKPSIREIKFTGFDEVKPSSVQEKLQVKQYTIVDEKKISSDLRIIEQAYIEKGYYLAKAERILEQVSVNEVVLTYKVTEGNPIYVGRINLLGNTYLPDSDLKAGLVTKERRWSSWLSSGGVFKDEFINRDRDYLAYLHRDNGFAEANVAAPQARLDKNRQRVEVGFFVEEGERYRMGSVSFSGDLLFTDQELKEKLTLKPGQIFRISQFSKDVQTLSDLYGDQGYAFVDVNPKTTLDRQKKTMDLEYVLTKGDKVYFRNIVIEGNSKTRDNVIRRNLKIAEGERFHATRLETSKVNLNRLGYFSDVQIVREPDHNTKMMDIRVKVKEKSTGQLSASIGASPSTNGRSFSFFAQGQFSENNLLGKGWASSITGRLTPDSSWSLGVSGEEPSINDGPWSLGIDTEYNHEIDSETPLASDESKPIVRSLLTRLTLGREIIEDLRFSVGYTYERVRRSYIHPAFRLYTKVGTTELFTQALRYNKTDSVNSMMSPTSGVDFLIRNSLGIQLLDGEYFFGKLEASLQAFYPIDFTETYRTNFRFAFQPGYVYPLRGRPVPVWQRFTLGSAFDMKAYQTSDLIISPKRAVMTSPWERTRFIPLGGSRRYFTTLEYFIPVIPEANLRFVTFYEAGTVLDDEEAFSFANVKHDVGFGFRWQTPIAPFRFEWAWPVEKGHLGISQFIFMVGLDTATRFN